MNDEALLDELLSQWQAEKARGRDLPASTLCSNCPEMAAQLARRIEALRRMSALANEGAATPMPSATAAPVAPAALVSVVPLVRDLRQYRLLDAAQLGEVEAQAAHFADAKALAAELMRRGWLTPHQANRLLMGRGRELVVGSYVLLERLGEGGMGTVYKARNWKLGRVVALKLIRPDRLANPDAVRRFRREVQAAAALAHPNIVHAYDADEIGGTHLLVMECVEGATDLARLVAKKGPLPVEQACEYVRQAALGLQHAHERGMVHRDIKPQNMLLSQAQGSHPLGLVKLLDMGLARLDQPAPDGQKSSTMTQEGAIMGTPDYIAPEQVMGSHGVDIRADLYSLGCTFYHLLTGRVPFPGGTLMQKLDGHRFHEAAAVESLRPDVPPEVAAIVRKLMAKRPEDRYQTPAELAEELADLARPEAEIAPSLSAAQATVMEVGPSAVAADTADPWSAVTLAPAAPAVRPSDRRRLLWVGAAGGVVFLGLAAALVVLLRTLTAPAPEPAPTVADRKPSPPPRPAPVPLEQWLRAVAELPPEQQVEEVRARLKERNPQFDGEVKPVIADGAVVHLTFCSDNVKDLSPVRALPGLTGLTCEAKDYEHSQVTDLSPLAGTRLTYLDITGNQQLRDLSPLHGLPLQRLECSFTAVSDLTPLRGMPLDHLAINNCWVRDLSPLRGVPLTELRFGGWSSPISDLSPLEGMPLVTLMFGQTQVRDLSPLHGLPLRDFRYNLQVIPDLSPLKDSPLETFEGDFNPWRDAEVLRGIKALKTINGQPAEKFWEKMDADRAAFDRWAAGVAAMPPDDQVRAVAAKLKELNPDFDGKTDHGLDGGAVVRLTFSSEGVTDLSPVRALAGLRELSCGGTAGSRKGKLAELAPLRGLKLTSLACNDTQVDDLGALAGMPLERLDVARTPVRALAPLGALPLRQLVLDETPVADLSPLKGIASLRELSCRRTDVGDLSPLSGLGLTSLDWTGSPVADVSPLRGLPLAEVACEFHRYRDDEILRSIKGLKRVNGMPVADFWEKAATDARAFDEWCRAVTALPPKGQVEAVSLKLHELNPGFDESVSPINPQGAVKELSFLTDNVTDLSPVRALPQLEYLVCAGGGGGKGKLYDLSPLKGVRLTQLVCAETKVADLSPLSGMSLERLDCFNTRVKDLSPLAGMPLTYLACQNTQGSDLSPLKGMKLAHLDAGNLKVSDLSALKGMPLTYLDCHATRVTDLSPLKGMPLDSGICDYYAERDAEILRSLTTLRVINDKPAAAFWKAVGAAGR